MKKIMLLTILTAIAGSAFSQADPVTSIQNGNSNLSYLLKAQKQRTAAWVCLGSGLALVTTAAIVGGTKATEDFLSIVTFQEPTNNYTAENTLLIIGGIGIAASIPLFIGATKNKQKARLKITDQKTAIGIPIAVPKKITGLTLSISI